MSLWMAIEHVLRQKGMFTKVDRDTLIYAILENDMGR